MSAPKNYRSFAEFRREELDSDQKLGWSLEDLWKDAELRFDGAGGDPAYDERDLDEPDAGA